MSNYKNVAKRLMYARTISFFGSAFSDLVLPLFIYETTKSPVLLGLQWTVNALFRLVTGKLAGSVTLWKTDKSGLIWLDFLQGLAALVPLLFWSSAPALGTYISGVALAIFVTLQAGFIDSLVRHITSMAENHTEARTWFNANLDKGKNIGLFLGYLVAWLAATYAGFKVAIIIDSLTFFISAAITVSIKDSHNYQQVKAVKASYSLLFQNKIISLLTASQAFLSFSIYIFNSAFIYTMKHSFDAPNSAIATLLIMQSVCYIIGSTAASRVTKISLKTQALLRFSFVVIFIGFAFSSNYTQFITWNAVLSILVSFTQPGILSLFQSFASPETSRSLGSARASVMAVTGSVGAAITGVLLSSMSFSFVFGIATITSLIGSSLFLVMFKIKKISQP